MSFFGKPGKFLARYESFLSASVRSEKFMHSKENRTFYQNNNNNNNNLIIYIALFTCADQKRFTVISLKTIKVYIIIHKQLKPKR